MLTRIKTALVLSKIILLFFLFVGCFSNTYIIPKHQLDSKILKEAKAIISNIENNLSEPNRKELQSVGLLLNKNKFSVTTNIGRNKLLLPAQGNLSSFATNDQKSYLKLMCEDDIDCQVKLTKYNSIHYLIHELYHIINKEKYKEKISNSMVKKPNGKTKIMSFDEEIRAESVVVKYLSIYEPELLKEYKSLFIQILENKKVNMNGEEMKKKWDGFKLRDFRQINNAKLYFFVKSSDQISNLELEKLLFEKK